MNLEEAKSKLVITPEEEKSVGDYINHFHTQINVLSSFDVVKYLELFRKGWGLSGAEIISGTEKNDNEELGQTILDRIDDFANVYSAMCKYSQTERGPSYLLRGTSNDEAKKLKGADSYDRIISTTTRMDVAKTFTEYNNAAILRIDVGKNIPFINVDNFFGTENIHREENEIILSPFSKISRVEHSYDDDEYSYYNVRLEKPELRPFKEGEKEQFRERIKKDFSKILELGREYSNLYDQDEIDYYRLKKAQDQEDIDYLNERMRENFRRRKELEPELEGFSEMMNHYIQGLCEEKQREYEEAKRIVDEDTKKRIGEEREKMLEENRKAQISNHNLRVSETSQIFSKMPENIEFYSSDLILKAENYLEMCKILGIAFDSPVDIQSISSCVDNINGNINKVVGQIDLTTIPEDSEETLEESSEEAIDAVYLPAKEADRLCQSLHESVQEYDKQAINNIKKGIDHKVQIIIQTAKLAQLLVKKEEVQKRKVSWIGSITGQKRLKEIELENLDLQIEFEKSKPIVQKSSYSVHDSLSDMIAFSKGDLDGNLTPAMQELLVTVPTYFGINRKSIERSANAKLNSKPMVLNSASQKTSERISRLSEDNLYLRHGIQENTYQNASQTSDWQYGGNNNSGVTNFMDTLNKISHITEFQEFFQRSNDTKSIENKGNDIGENIR